MEGSGSSKLSGFRMGYHQTEGRGNGIRVDERSICPIGMDIRTLRRVVLGRRINSSSVYVGRGSQRRPFNRRARGQQMSEATQQRAGWFYKLIVNKHVTGPPLPGQISIGGVWGTPSQHLHFSVDRPLDKYVWWESPAYYLIPAPQPTEAPSPRRMKANQSCDPKVNALYALHASEHYECSSCKETPACHPVDSLILGDFLDSEWGGDNEINSPSPAQSGDKPRQWIVERLPDAAHDRDGNLWGFGCCPVRIVRELAPESVWSDERKTRAFDWIADDPLVVNDDHYLIRVPRFTKDGAPLGLLQSIEEEMRLGVHCPNLEAASASGKLEK